MRLVHFSPTPLALSDLVPRRQGALAESKPQGLWLSDEDETESWSRFCDMADFRQLSTHTAYEVELAEDANMLHLRSSYDLRSFTEEYQVDRINRTEVPSGEVFSIVNSFYMDWARVAEQYDGILITPYVWHARNGVGTSWYYPWDCASGCVWEPKAIASMREVPWPGSPTES